MKYQTTINFPVGKQVVVLSRKTFFGYLTAASVVFGICYLLYLQHLAHGGWLPFPKFFHHAKPATVAVAVAAPAVPSVAVVKNPMVAIPVESAPAPVAQPAVPQTKSLPVATQPVTASPIARVVIGKGIYMQLPPAAIASQQSTLPAHPQNLSDADRLVQAGNEAFGNLIYMANSQRDACGFLPNDNLRHAQLGDPVPVYEIAAPDRAGYQSDKAVKPLLKATERWMFPVLVDSQIRCMLQVERNGHNYSYVPGSTSKTLGMAWNKILEKWPTTAGYHPQLLINPEMPGYYFTVPELAEQNITDTEKMLYSPGDLSPAAVSLASWR